MLLVPGIRIRSADGDEYPQLMQGKIDTGASRTVVPTTVLDHFQSPVRNFTLTQLADETIPPRRLPIQPLVIECPGVLSLELVVAAMPRRNVLLGMDFLSHVYLATNGRRMTLGKGITTRIATGVLRFVGLT